MATAFSDRRTIQPHALVVDDSQIARYVLSGLLTKLGFDVGVAPSAESALKQLAGPLPDIVFMDHLLPGMDGLEAVGRLRAQSRTAKLPIVMYTSQESEAFARMARKAGANDVYTKTSEPSVLGDILRRLNLMPASPSLQTVAAKVVPIRGERGGRPHSAQPNRKLTPAMLVKLLEPSLAAHHAKLHQDLLAEFAILERYEERMRRDLFARVDALTNHATACVERAFAERRRERELECRVRARRWWGMAAAVVLACGVSLAMMWVVVQRNQQLELQGAAMFAKLDAQAEALNAFEARALAARPALDGDSAVSAPVLAPAERETVSQEPEQHTTPVAPLVAELQSMGILGPVRIETSAGSFCVRSTGHGLQIEASNLRLEECEALPFHLAAANW